MEQLHQRLLEPSAYPETTQSVAFQEIHVHLTATHVLKEKETNGKHVVTVDTTQTVDYNV